MSFRVFLVDDEPLAVARMQRLLAAYDDVEVVGSAFNGEEAVEGIEALKPNLVFLDIHMPRRSGMAVAVSLQDRADTDVIFITAFEEFAREAFEVDAVDYLLKPIDADRLTIALDRARRRTVQAGPTPEPLTAEEALKGFWVQKRRGLVRIPLETINWIEAARDYVLLHTVTGSHMLRTTMEALQDQLDPHVYVRVSRSAFVRRASVVFLQKQGSAGYVAVLADGMGVKVGGTFTKAAINAFGENVVE